MRAYEYAHVVSFEETNVVGNVYFTRYLSWQGRCRELFLREHVPRLAEELSNGLRLVTTRASCEYFAELRAFDEVLVRMTLRSAGQTRVAMAFEYVRRGADGDVVVARGEQEAACLREQDGAVVPAALPAELRDALDGYG